MEHSEVRVLAMTEITGFVNLLLRRKSPAGSVILREKELWQFPYSRQVLFVVIEDILRNFYSTKEKRRDGLL